jgi:Fe2+ or Zn2+ uptake regulation protein
VDALGASGLTNAELVTRIRRAGLRATQPRMAVYDALRGLGGHRSADELLLELGRQARRVSRMSVYNALSALHQAGLVMQADAGPGRTLYEVSPQWHHHFVCRSCGGLFDVPCVRGRKPCLRPPSMIGRADEAQIIFRGVCRKCARRQAGLARTLK